jgi:hypothetical protein
MTHGSVRAAGSMEALFYATTNYKFTNFAVMVNIQFIRKCALLVDIY